MTQSSKKGCWIGLLILAILAAVLGYLYWSATQTVTTEIKPLDASEIARFEKKSTFMEHVVMDRAHTPDPDIFAAVSEETRTLVLSQREILHYVYAQIKEATNHLPNLDIELLQDEAKLAANVRMPKEMGGDLADEDGKLAKLEGLISVKMTTEDIDIRLKKLSLGAIPITNGMMKMFTGKEWLNRNLTQDMFNRDPEGLQEFLNRVKLFKIEPGQVVLELYKVKRESP